MSAGNATDIMLTGYALRIHGITERRTVKCYEGTVLLRGRARQQCLPRRVVGRITEADNRRQGALNLGFRGIRCRRLPTFRSCGAHAQHRRPIFL
ncbi:hypothetical protein RHDC4_01340 [Rhodocyclaceae bacterium]|nr:hypothetical protein RHDC4_01340 [Rhodocyclaceae bacterium]